jgi:cellulose synthase/poly-beta-1,6-N-acetylglucosamine synthase-like glycosyltransferase
MIGFLWLNTYWFPTIVFLGGLILALWLIGKAGELIDWLIKNAYRLVFHAYGKCRDNFKQEEMK